LAPVAGVVAAGLITVAIGFLAGTNGFEVVAGLFGVGVMGFFKAGEADLAMAGPPIPAVPR
jgi:hypothetical protein